MKTMTDQNIIDAILKPPKAGKHIEPEHRDWMNAQIRDTLCRKLDNEFEYHSLDKVRDQFGF